jgi:hypothetical protein
MPSAAAVWTVITGPVPFGRARDSLGRDELEIVRSELARATDEFRAADGSYTFPTACRLYWGSK